MPKPVKTYAGHVLYNVSQLIKRSAKHPSGATFHEVYVVNADDGTEHEVNRTENAGVHTAVYNALVDYLGPPFDAAPIVEGELKAQRESAAATKAAEPVTEPAPEGESDANA